MQLPSEKSPVLSAIINCAQECAAKDCVLFSAQPDCDFCMVHDVTNPHMFARIDPSGKLVSTICKTRLSSFMPSSSVLD